MQIKGIILACSVAVSLPAFGLELALTPGSLGSRVPDIEGTLDKTLVLRGTADVRDLVLLSRVSRSVSTLDMSALTINSYTYTGAGYHGLTAFAAGQLPPYMLAGTSVETVVFPANATELSAGTFALSGLKEVTIPASVKKIGDNAFAGSKRLERINYEGTPGFGKNVFHNCPALVRHGLDDKITEIPEGMFNGCTSLPAIPTGVKKIGARAFEGSGILSADLTNVSEVGDYAFANDEALVEIRLGENQVKFGKAVFMGDTGLGYVPAWHSDTPESLFLNSGVASPEIINSPEIGEAAYANKPEIRTLTFGASVQKIDANAFRNIRGLQEVNVVLLKDNVPELSPEAFAGLENAEGRYDVPLLVHEVSIEKWREAPVWQLFDIRPGDMSGTDDIKVDVTVSARRQGQTLEVTSNAPIDLLQVYNVDGIALADLSNASTEATVDVPADGVLVVRVISGGSERVIKLR